MIYILKRWGILIFDLISVGLSIGIAYYIRFKFMAAVLLPNGRSNNVAFGLIIMSYLIVFAFDKRLDIQEIMNHGHFHILQICVEINLIMAAILTVVLYLSQTAYQFSRLFFTYFILTDVILMFCFMELLRAILHRRYALSKKQVIIFAQEENYEEMARGLLDAQNININISAMILIENGDIDCTSLYKVTTGNEKKTIIEAVDINAEEFLLKEVVDVAVISLPDVDNKKITELITNLESMGIDVHLTLDSLNFGLRETTVEDYGKLHVITFSPRIFSERDLFLKRMLDILGGIVGTVLCLIIGIFVAPAIFIEDPGPIIFKQKRVGKNGRFFYIYKFRSMYQDAEERKKELMAQNEMDGLMFKMKDDPRITKVGNFIRKTSLDEFPQFLNVLIGDMSLVGTRPPTVEEFNQYSVHHKRRLSLKPGITGLWQVSGRSDITDFEEVVRLDTEYIDNWTFQNDIRILLKTVVAVFRREGSE